MLFPTVLSTALLDLFLRPEDSVDRAAQKMADAYDSYASVAQAGVAFPHLLGTEKVALKNILAQALLFPIRGRPDLFADAWVNGLVAFWTLPPVLFQTPPFPAPPLDSGIPVPLPSMAGTLRSAIISLVSKYNTALGAAQSFAAAIDVATRQFQVTFAPSGLIFPLS